MLVVAKLHCLLLVETSESFSSAQLVLRCHLKGTHGARVAVIFNCVHNVREAMHLGQVTLWHFNFFFVTLVGVLILFLFIPVF